MNFIEKEKLIKADIVSIENRVRHAFNQGYDLGFKDGKKAKPQDIDYKAQYERFSKKADIVISQLRADRDRLMSLTSVTPQEPKWIPVSERLPNKEEYIANNGLFIVSDGNRTYAEYFDVYDAKYFGEPTLNVFRVDRCVTAWMPLPKAYREVEE